MIVAVGSWRGTGTTTTALLLAACVAMRNEAGSWLIEADPAGGAIAGRMQLTGNTIGGLERVAFPTARIAPVDAFESAAHKVAGLRIVSAPSDPFRAHACHQPRLPWISSLRELEGSVVIDVGRLRSGSPAWPILAAADLVLVVTSPEISAAVSTSEWMQANGRVSPVDPGLASGKARIVFVDSPGGVPFPRSMLSSELGDQFAAWLPWDPTAVDLIYRGAMPDDRRLRRSALIAAVNEVALDMLKQEVDA
jgi:MinD-like ATPase involved in chromosome partitioning or flagellar assembly